MSFRKIWQCAYHHAKNTLTFFMLEDHLKKYFNFSEFRPGQKEIVESIVAGRDVVALMPTGGGKSLCYQLPAILSGKLTVVVSPLIALMKDQVDSLNARGIQASFINSSLKAGVIEARTKEVKGGRIKILYIAPERLASEGFFGLFANLDIYLLAIDEAHCVSQWGHDFRPEYLKIKNYIEKLKRRPIIAAFTATATPEVKDDIIQRLGLKDPQVFIRGFDRPNLKFFVKENLSKKERRSEALRIARSIDGAGIFYTITRKEAEETAEFMQKNGITSAFYHAGMKSEDRNRIQNDFMENKFRAIVATIAFGMGVDKADIRYVIHLGMPGSLEGYYQEAGRAGRDGEKAYCILLHSGRDTGLHYYFLQKSRDEMLAQGKSRQEINSVLSIKYDRLEKILDYVSKKKCRRKMILEYFSDPDLKNHGNNCQGCDVCLDFKWPSATESQDKNFDKDNFIVKGEQPETLSDTILETVKLYKSDYDLDQIAKMRNLGKSTIFGHLIKWYSAGGELDPEKFITREEERQILVAMSKAENYQKLKPIKDHLPESISYEKIRLVIAKIRRINLG